MKRIPTYTILDFETSGYDPSEKKSSSHKVMITQVACVVVSGDKLEELDRYESYVLPYDSKLEWQEGAEKITGITKQMLYDKGKHIKAVFKEMSELISKHSTNNQKTTLVGQNIPFDIDFLVRGYEIAGGDIYKTWNCTTINGMPIPQFIDLMDLAKLDVQSLKSYNLESICEHYGVEYLDGHDAMNDVLITLEAFKAIVHKLRNNEAGVGSVKQESPRKTFEFI